MRFDAYAGSIKTDRPFEEVAHVFAHDLGAVIARGKALRRVGEVLRVEHGGHCAVWVGRDHGNDSIYFEAKGESTPEVVKSVRARFEHGVSRVDVCEDYDEEEAFQRLRNIITAAKGPRVRGFFERLPDDPAEGATWAAGVRGSVAYLRLYEAGKMKERLHHRRPNWVRCEIEARPKSRDKAAVASMSPLEVCGLSAWTHRVAEAVTTVEVPRYEAQREAPTFDKTTLYLARAFRRHWEEMLAHGETWPCIGRTFEDVWANDDALAALLQSRGGLS